MIEMEMKLGEEEERLIKLSASISGAIIELFEKKNLTGQEIFYTIKNLIVCILDNYENEMELAELLFKDVREGLSKLQDFNSKTTFTLQQHSPSNRA